MNVFTGESIKERREELNMTQDDLADELGTYRSLISD
ncbi:transcriptional regulator, partial [Salmonella enterica subsp. enterica serovar Typhimurium]